MFSPCIPHTNSSLARGEGGSVSPITLDDDLTFKPSKRARTRSPESVRRTAFARTKERVRARTEEYMRRMNAEREARRDARERALMEDIIAEMPEDIRSNGV
jgi:hypothetical protein